MVAADIQNNHNSTDGNWQYSAAYIAVETGGYSYSYY